MLVSLLSMWGLTVGGEKHVQPLIVRIGVPLHQKIPRLNVWPSTSMLPTNYSSLIQTKSSGIYCRYYAPHLWNKLFEYRSAQNVKSLKSGLRTLFTAVLSWLYPLLLIPICMLSFNFLKLILGFIFLELFEMFLLWILQCPHSILLLIPSWF